MQSKAQIIVGHMIQHGTAWSGPDPISISLLEDPHLE